MMLSPAPPDTYNVDEAPLWPAPGHVQWKITGTTPANRAPDELRCVLEPIIFALCLVLPPLAVRRVRVCYVQT